MVQNTDSEQIRVHTPEIISQKEVLGSKKCTTDTLATESAQFYYKDHSRHISTKVLNVLEKDASLEVLRAESTTSSSTIHALETRLEEADNTKENLLAKIESLTLQLNTASIQVPLERFFDGC